MIAHSPTAQGRQPLRLLTDADFSYVRDGFQHSLTLPIDTEPHLYGALRDSLDHPGSLARAQLAFGIMNREGADRLRARDVAVAIEYFHTASLLFDDLPSMDDATERRGQLCPHILYGEAATQLAALSFITRAYSMILQGLAPLDAQARVDASQLLEQCVGVAGILNGQARDLNFSQGAQTPEQALAASRGKTASLIRLTLELPALMAGAPARVRADLAELADAWGLAYQVLDDLKDCYLSGLETGKTIGRDAELGRPNFVVAAGFDPAREKLRQLLRQGSELLARLDSAGWSNCSMSGLQQLMEKDAADIESRVGFRA